MAKVQGEGDYESARRYNSRTRRFVEQKGTAATKGPEGSIDKEALRKARSKAKDAGQDARDERVFRSGMTARGKKSTARKPARKTASPRKAH